MNITEWLNALSYITKQYSPGGVLSQSDLGHSLMWQKDEYRRPVKFKRTYFKLANLLESTADMNCRKN